MSFDTTKQGITDTLSGDIIVNTECNPLHGPRVEQIIKQLQAGETPEKQAYVEEGIYAHGSDVASVSIDGTDYEVTEVTQMCIRDSISTVYQEVNLCPPLTDSDKD